MLLETVYFLHLFGVDLLDVVDLNVVLVNKAHLLLYSGEKNLYLPSLGSQFERVFQFVFGCKVLFIGKTLEHFVDTVCILLYINIINFILVRVYINDLLILTEVNFIFNVCDNLVHLLKHCFF